MSALLSISLWVTLATVVPGFVTIAVLFLCLAAADVPLPALDSDWVMVGIAVTLMVLTQSLGILLEEFLIRFRLLGAAEQPIWAPDGDQPGCCVEVWIKPYEQYHGLYVLLAQMSEREDSQGHLKRSVAQFFLTTNTLVSFGAGVILAFALMITGEAVLAYYSAGLLAAFGISYWVARIRFREMSKSLWAVQNYRSTQPRAAANGGATP